MRNPIAELQTCSVFISLFYLFLTGCSGFDDARILQLLNERGFGRHSSGNCNECFYFGVGDSLSIKDKFNSELRGKYQIRMDGTVDLPLLGETYIAGFTAKEIASMLNTRFSHFYKYVSVTVAPGRITSKKFFVHLDTDRHLVKKFTGGQTLYDVLMNIRYNSIDVDLGNIKVIRPDPVHPLVIHCNLNDMIHHGKSRDNILIKEDDIIFFTPTVVGYFKQLVKTLVSPLSPLVQLFTGASRIDAISDSFSNREYF